MSDWITLGYRIDDKGHPVTVVRPGDTAPCFYCNDIREALTLIDLDIQQLSETPPSETQ